MRKYNEKIFVDKIYDKYGIKIKLTTNYLGIYEDIGYICPKCNKEHIKSASLVMTGRFCTNEKQYIDDGTYIVYKHTNNVNGKVYIGITCHKNPNERWHGGTGYKNNSHFYSAIKKYGWDNFSHEVIYSGLPKEMAEQKEIELIEKYNSTDKNYGYNHHSGGGATNSPTEQTRKKISQKLKGQKLSKETKEKMSKSRSGNKNCNAVPVGRFDNGNLIKKWDCMTTAAEEVGISNKLIWTYCKYNRKDKYGYEWQYI